jgi:hypothetical protein
LRRAAAPRLRRCPAPLAACCDAGTTRRAEAAATPAAAGAPPPLRRRGALASISALAALCAPPSRALQLPSAAALFQAQPRSAQLQVDPAFASLLTGVADETREALGVLASTDAQIEFSRLFRQEWPYYQRANAARLPSLPELGNGPAVGSPGAAGGLSNPSYLNFVLYCLFKVLARHLNTPEARTAFTRALGDRLLAAVAPGATAVAAAPPPPGADADAPLRAAIRQLLDAFVAGGYAKSYSLAWDNSMPFLPGVPGADAAVAAAEAASGAFGSRGRAERFQLRVEQPADLEGGVALRAEEDGFWAALVPAALGALLRSANRPAEIDEVYFQDAWQGPAALSDRVLLALGDPFFTVEVPFVPDVLICDGRFTQTE